MPALPPQECQRGSCLGPFWERPQKNVFSGPPSISIIENVALERNQKVGNIKAPKGQREKVLVNPQGQEREDFMIDFTEKFKNLPLQEKIALKRADRIQSVPAKARGLFSRVYAHKTRGYKGPVKAFCLECVGFDRQAVADCTAYACPLYDKRPFQGKKRRTDKITAAKP